MKNKERLIQETDSPVAATLAISFLEKSEDNIRRVARAKNRTYKSLTSASNDGLARRHLIPAIQNALMESICEACATDTTTTDNRLREDGLKVALQTYMQAA